MRSLILVTCIHCLTMVGVPMFALAQMVRSDSLHQDPAKLALCIQRTKEKHEIAFNEIQPFEIDKSRVEQWLKDDPDTTFFVTDGQMVTCEVNSGTGKYGPISFAGENDYWHPIRPAQFSPGIHTREGENMAVHACFEAAKLKIDRPDFDHIIYLHVGEVAPNERMSGVQTAPFDIEVAGTSFYRSKGIDLDGIEFTCLFSPMLEIKAVLLQAKR